MGRLAVVLFILLCFGMAGGTYVRTIHQPTQTMQAAEPVEGTVESTHVEATDSDSGTTYSPVVTYEYTFDGQTYTNDNIELIGEPGFDTPDGAEEFLQSYTAGDRVTVYVDPRNPSRSFLRRGSQGLLIYGVIGAVGIMGLLGVVALVADLSGADWVDIK